MTIRALSGWTSEQRHVVAASFLGWSLDTFDFFLLVFVLKDIAAEFNTDISHVSITILVTLAMRPVGAFLFGRAAESAVPPNASRGRRPDSCETQPRSPLPAARLRTAVVIGAGTDIAFA